MFWELLVMGINNLSKRRLRSFLTLLGVFIGIGAVVALISISNGMQAAVSEALEDFGANNIYIIPESGGGIAGFSGVGLGESLREKDLDRIRNIKGVEIAVPALIKTLPVEYNGEKETLWVVGIPPKESSKFFSDVQSLELTEGRYISERDKYSATIGYLVKNEVFSDKVELKSRVTVKDVDFRVVGTFKRIGNPQDDSQIYIPLDTLREITGEGDEISAIFAKSSDNPNDVADRIEKELEKLHGEDLFTAMTAEQLQEQIQSIFGVLSIALGGIASISLIVAGFGIANTMLMSVLERTREIGIMKAVGASNRMVMFVFLMETAILGLIGGIGGIVLGEIIYIVLAQVAINLGVVIPIIFSPMLLSSALLFSIVVGVVSGLYPAWRASRLSPVEALRYE